MILLASTGHTLRAGSSNKKEADPADGLPMLAVQCIVALLKQCSSAAQLQSVLSSLPPQAVPSNPG
jgi:hypothetical protein